MPLHKTQKDFMNGILKKESDILSAVLKTDDISAEQRLKIYQNNAQLILTDTLKATFPVVNALVGDSFFNQTAQIFITEHPPKTGDMNSYGDVFPHFLAQLDSLNSYAYMGDIAQLEWLRHVCYLSPQNDALTAEDLANIEPESVPALKLSLQPHIQLLTSPYPIDKIWFSNQSDTDTEDVDLNTGTCYLVVFQKDNSVVVWPVEEALYVLLQNFRSGETFENAITNAMAIDESFATDQFLPLLIQSAFFIK